MESIIENNAEEEWIGLENSKEDSEDDFKYEELKRQVRCKYRAVEKQAMRRYLKKEDPDYVVIINSKIYKNPGDKTRKRRYKNSGSSDSGADVMRIRPNPLSLYNAGSEQEWRIFVNVLDNY